VDFQIALGFRLVRAMGAPEGRLLLAVEFYVVVQVGFVHVRFTTSLTDVRPSWKTPTINSLAVSAGRVGECECGIAPQKQRSVQNCLFQRVTTSGGP
jgi:hypothetical protein